MIYTLRDVQNNLRGTVDEARVAKLYAMISNPEKRVSDQDKQWVACQTQAHENHTVVKAIREILAENRELWIEHKDQIIKSVDRVCKRYEDAGIVNKPRIPFYIQVLDLVMK